MGWGFPGPDPPPGTYREWEPDGRIHQRNWTRDFTAFLWTDLANAGDFAAADSRLTGIHRAAYLSNQYIDEDGIAVGTLQSHEVLLPAAYDNGDGTYSGWWEGTSQGKTWHGDVDLGFPFYEMNFAFKGVMHGKGLFKGMTLYTTISVANAIEFGFEIQGYILDRT